MFEWLRLYIDIDFKLELHPQTEALFTWNKLKKEIAMEKAPLQENGIRTNLRFRKCAILFLNKKS